MTYIPLVIILVPAIIADLFIYSRHEWIVVFLKSDKSFQYRQVLFVRTIETAELASC